MVSRVQDWLDQAQRDLDHARNDLSAGYHEWACFSTHQAAEKALKALYQYLSGEAWGHSVKRLLEELSAAQQPTASKPLPVQRRSCGSVRIAFLNREQAIAELAECAQQLLERDKRVIAVGLFGSLARGQALPSSDADLLIVLKAHPLPRWFDRIPEYTLAFQGTALPVEPFPYTKDELVRLLSGPGFLRTAIREKIVLAGDEMIFNSLQTP